MISTSHDIGVTDNSPGVAVFDVCDTLYFSNTTHDFVEFVVASTQKYRARHWLMNSKFLPFRYLFLVISRYFGGDPLRNFNVGLLRGRSRDEVAELARKFVTTFLEKRKIEPVHMKVRSSQAEGQRVILCSTSIEPVVAAISANLGGVEYICSTLEFLEGRYTGRIADDVGTSKLERLEDLGVADSIDVAYSDNLGDLKLLRAARHPFAVVHSERKKAFWSAHKIEVLCP